MATTQKKEALTDLSPEEMALRIEKDIKTEARRWKVAHPPSRGRSASPQAAATRIAATYLSNHRELYQAEGRQALLDKHQYWMELMEAWFLATIKG